MKILILLLSFFFITSLQAQIYVGPKEQVKFKTGKFKKEDLAKLKSSKTIFLYPKGTDTIKLEKAIKSVWDITPISLVSYEKYKKLDLTNISVISPSSFSNTLVRQQTGKVVVSNSFSYYKLWMYIKNKKGKWKKKNFARIDLHDADENWNPGFIKVYLANINELLKNETERWLYESETKDELRNLKDNILYIPDYVLIKFNKYTGDRSERLDPEQITRSYPFKLEFIDTEELNNKILSDNEKTFYFLIYVKSSTEKYVSVFNSKTGEIIYSKYKPMSYNFKKGDLKDIAKAIKKL